jgi:hypothetical protein
MHCTDDSNEIPTSFASIRGIRAIRGSYSIARWAARRGGPIVLAASVAVRLHEPECARQQILPSQDEISLLEVLSIRREPWIHFHVKVIWIIFLDQFQIVAPFRFLSFHVEEKRQDIIVADLARVGGRHLVNANFLIGLVVLVEESTCRNIFQETVRLVLLAKK